MKLIHTVFLLFAAALGGCASTPTAPQRQEVVGIIDKVNTYWQANTPAREWSFWNVAAYHTGNMEAYRITGNQAYLKYSLDWAQHTQWQGAKSTDKRQWKLTYGETDDHVLFGDWQICFQTYADLYQLDKDPARIARAREVMEYQMSTARNDYWWWADGL